MSKLNFIMRGKRDPQGKSRIFFCSHPLDAPLYFQEITDDLFDILERTAAVWYDEKPREDADDTFFSDLSRMQLFVVPVTERFLREPSRARDEELPYALEHHIPVLPLLQENDVPERFEKVFGNLQALGKNIKDKTALRYEDKLRKYLSSVLIGDELAARIRREFSACIFMSYRKKDRQHAQALMKRIHENELCRDIAIWYDEFLVPGEDFNTSIEASLAQSDLFVLAVTPNLNEDDNYVMRVEYPAAVKKKKIILPIEVVATDRKALSDRYPDIPDCTDAHDSEALARTMREAIRAAAICPKEDTPWHRYYVGLAYLGGIDVETDRKRAIALIESAADGGCLEAAEKLVSIYRNGEGARRSYEKAIQWQERLLNLRQAAFEREPNENNAYLYLYEYWDLGDYVREMQRMQEALKIYRGMLRESERLNRAYDSLRLARLSADAHSEIGDVLMDLSRHKDAMQHYLTALHTAEELLGILENDRTRHLYISLLKSLGNVHEKRQSYGDAKAFYEKALRMEQAIAESDPSDTNRRNVSISLSNLGDVYLRLTKHGEAIAYYERALQIHTELADGNHSDTLQMDIANLHISICDVYRAQMQYGEALEHAKKAFAISESADRKLARIATKRRLSLCCERIGHIYESLGQLNPAEEYLRRSFMLDSEIEKQSDSDVAKRDLLLTLSNLGDIALKRKNVKEAEAYYQRSLQIAEALAARSQLPQAKADVSQMMISLGDLYAKTDDYSKAKAYFEDAFRIRSALAAQSDSIQHKKGLTVVYERLGDLYLSAGDTENAEKFHRAAVENNLAILEKTDEPWVCRALMLAYCKLGQVYAARSAEADAAEAFQKAIGLAETEAARTGAADSRHDLFSCYDELAELMEKQGRFAAAYEHYGKALSVITALARETQNESHGASRVRCIIRLAHNAHKLGKFREASALYEDAAVICETAHRRRATDETRERLCSLYNAMGHFYSDLGKNREAILYFKKDLALTEELRARHITDVSILKNLAISYRALYDIYNGIGQQDDAIPYLVALSRTYEELHGGAAEKMPAVYFELARYYEKKERLKNAEFYYRKLVSAEEYLCEFMPSESAVQDFAKSNLWLGEILEQTARHRLARDCYRKAIDALSEHCEKPQERFGELLTELLHRYATASAELKLYANAVRAYLDEVRLLLARDGDEAKQTVAKRYEAIAALFRLQNNAAEAEAYEEKANAVWRELALRSGDPELLRDLSIEYGKRAMTLQQNKRLREALTEFLQALAIDERLAKEAPSSQSLRDLAITCGQLAELYDEMGNADEQKSYRARELELREMVADQDDLPELWDELAVTHYNYALLFSNSRESVRHFQRARDIWESLARRCPENPTYKNRRDTASRALSDI